MMIGESIERTSRASFRPKTYQLPLHVVLALLRLRAAPAISDIDTLVILHTNDFHGYISPDGDRAAGLARIATYFNRERARRSKYPARPSRGRGSYCSKGYTKTTRYPAVGVV